jgi:hypothetical protein
MERDPGAHWIGFIVNSRDDVDAVEKKITSCPHKK